ncbi:MAG: sigma-70 family RNA polymerase sigma factor [Planctomycetes bacterium]|nr:sigma-70 family RNA polymerase sigma factor [Planctomycetota bacterium]
MPSTHEIAEREELRAKIVAHVLALPEPYRTTLVLRFYEGLDPREIARVQRTNGSTVRNRVARGLALLRERLERERGSDWVSSCLAVLPLGSAQLLVAHAGWTGWVVKGGIVAKKIEIAAAAALVVVAGAVWFSWPSKSEVPLSGASGAGAVALASEERGVPLALDGQGERPNLEGADTLEAHANAASRKPAESNGLSAASRGVRVFGTVRDARGEPINASGGTFQLSFGGAPVNSDVPMIAFYTVQPTVVTDRQARSVITIEGADGRLEGTQPSASQATGSGESETVTLAGSGQPAITDPNLAAFDRLLTERLVNSLILQGSTRIVFADSEGCQFTANTNFDSTYSAEGLHAGTWHTIVTHDGKLCRRQDFEIEKEEHQHKLDISLDDPLQVRVRLRTPDGRELGEAIAADPELAAHVALSPVALRPGSAARSLPDGDNQSYGCGAYQARAQLDEKRCEELGDASGVLTITEAPPLEIGLAMCGQLIARRPLAPGQEEVEFVFSLEDLRHFFATLIVHVVDAQTHAPIAGASVSIEGVRTAVDTPSIAPGTTSVGRIVVGRRLADPAQGDNTQPANTDPAAADGAGVSAEVTGADGVLRVPWVMPGKRRVLVTAQSYSAFSGRLEIEDRGECDLRPIELTGHARISGRIFDSDGKPVRARLQLVPLERFEEAREDLAGTFWESSETGAFEIPHQRRERYVLRSAEGEGVLTPLALDASQGDVCDLELRLVTPARVRLNLTREPKEGAELRITTAAGLPMLERDLSGLAPVELSLAPGAYLAEVREGPHKAGSVRFVAQREAQRVVLTLD